MAVGSVSPTAVQQFSDANGDPLAGGKLFLYLAGTTTPTPAYADVGLTVPLANPVILDAGGWAPQLFLAALSYKQVLQNAAGVTIWTADNIITPTALRSTQGVISLTGTQHDVLIPAGIITFLLCQNSVPLTITGFAGGTPGQLLIVRSYGTAPVHLANWNASGSAAGNTLVNFAQSGPTSINGPGIAVYVYANLPHAAGQLHWMLVTHEQGAWIRMPYNATDFTALPQPGNEWNVEAGDIQQLDWKLSGTSLLLSVAITFSTVVGGPAKLVIGNLPYQVNTATGGLPATIYLGAGAFVAGLIYGQVAGNTVEILRADLAPWLAGSNGIHVYAQVTVDVK